MGSTKPRAAVLRVRDLRALCESVRASVVVDALATSAELEAVTPGSPGNRDLTVRGWLLYLRTLDRFHARLQQRSHAANGATHDSADAIIASALERRPEILTLCPDADGTPRSLAVHPKGFTALVQLDARDRLLQWLADAAERRITLGTGTPEDIAKLERLLGEIGYQQGICAWIATSPGAGLPYDDGMPRPDVPSGFLNLDPVELLLILRAHRTVNANRLAVLNALITPDPDKSTRRPSWSTFFATMAMEHGIAPAELMRDWTLAELLASTALAASAQRDAMADAEARAKQKGGVH